jgi:dipeptidyl-peptidase-4
MDGKLKNRLTDGKWQVSNVLLIDEEDGVVFFTAKKEASTRTDLYKVKFNGKDLTRLTFGEFTHNINLSPKGSYFITSYSNVSSPTKMAVCNDKGKVLRELGDIRGKEFDNYELAKTELVYITTPDGYKLPATIVLPLDLDPNKKYPVLISIYGGPNMGTVSDGWKGIGAQWWALEGMITVSVDHRGSGHFGKEGVALMHRNLGKWEMNDYIECVKWLRSKPYVDAKKIAITGSSYGGYVTAMALTAGADYFTHGIAVSSPTDWRLYDTHYTERYMRTPAENPEGYKAGSVMTYAEKLKGVLRIVHGTMDDNVHMQNSIQLVDKLEDLGKHFEFMVYPGGRHGWGGAKGVHSRVETARFYYQYLLEKPFPEDQYAKLYQMGAFGGPGGGRRPR